VLIIIINVVKEFLSNIFVETVMYFISGFFDELKVWKYSIYLK